ncbi:TPA: SMI1/KNR4 family protein [Vibrio parahaemolyticus]|uniref:SMI1/KNR4 family protein n=1 Tax=Vibrio parahaemolyticus TaxID=670 RepID=UPI00041512CA|nr:SMI1/KNR4 family protein [Vibrio parahaemolyticus]HCE2224691.1 SMI1/KNR4 family protein [Vibrio parahaemolyticus]
MQKLKILVEEHQADTLPATLEQISEAQVQLGMTFSAEYREYLQQFGVISYGSTEVFGLGVKQSSHLNVVNVAQRFTQVCAFPKHLLPLAEIGDSHYYVYDNIRHNVLSVAIPDLGPKMVSNDLEEFLIDLIFCQI